MPFPDLLRLVHLSPGGRPIADLDFLQEGVYARRKESLKITPPAESLRQAKQPGRYGGMWTTGSQHENGQVSFTAAIEGSTHDAAMANVNALLGRVKEAGPNRLLELKLGGETRPGYHELRGPGTWTPTFSHVADWGRKAWLFDLTFPVAPLLRWARMDINDPFDSADSQAQDYTQLDGAGLYWRSDGGGLLGNSATSLRRAIHVARGYKYEDVQVTVTWNGGTSFGTRNGVILKYLDASNYLFVANASDGFLRIYKVDNGVLSALTALVAGNSPGMQRWIRGRIEGNFIYAERWLAKPTPMAVPSDGPLPHELTGGDATKFGAGVSGYAGLYFEPDTTDQWMNDFDVQPLTYRNRTLPDKITLGGTIPGNAPALCDLHVTPSGGSAPPVSAVIGWTKRPGAPIAGSVAPFGILEGESGADHVGWTYEVDAGSRGGNRLALTTAGAGSASATWAIDPSTLLAEEYSQGEISLEIWGVMVLASTLVTPKVVLSAHPFDGTDFGAERFADEGSVGRALVKPSAGTVRRPVRLGTLRLPTDPVRWKVRVAASWLTGSSGTIGLDYLVIVPARQRMASPTGMANDSAYPRFVPSIAETTRILKGDGSGAIAKPPGEPVQDGGLGVPLELPPGAVDLVVKLSSLVPDDPSVSAASEQLSHAATVHASVTPRSFLGRS